MDTQDYLPDAVDMLSGALPALRALSVMIGKTLAAHDPAGLSYGVQTLLDQQISTIAHVSGNLEDLLEAMEEQDDADTGMTAEERIAELMRLAALADAGRPAWHDLDTIAARSRVRKCDVARVMFILTGEDHEGAAYRAWDGNLAEGMHSHLLASLCWETLAHGGMWGQVSEATGLRLEKVKEVLQAMLEYSPKREIIDPRPFGEVLAAQEAEKAMHERVAKQDVHGPSETALADAVDRLRRADLEAVARDTNLAETTVRRVVERLLAEPPGNPDSAARNG